MFTVLRLSGAEKELSEDLVYLKENYDKSLEINRQNKIVIDMSKSDDWATHYSEIQEAINKFVNVWKRSGIENIEFLLDPSLDMPKKQKKGVQVFAYNFDVELLKILVDNNIELEITLWGNA